MDAAGRAEDCAGGIRGACAGVVAKREGARQVAKIGDGGGEGAGVHGEGLGLVRGAVRELRRRRVRLRREDSAGQKRAEGVPAGGMRALRAEGCTRQRRRGGVMRLDSANAA